MFPSIHPLDSKRYRRLGAQVLLVLFGISAANSTIAKKPVIDKPWCEYTTPGYRLTTDLPLVRAEKLLRELENFDRATRSLLPITINSKVLSTAEIIAFAKTKNFKDFTDTKYFSGLTLPSLQSIKLIIGATSQRQSLTSIAFHEYVHYLLRRHSPLSLPIWYEEGLASMFGNVRLTKDSATYNAPKLNEGKTGPSIQPHLGMEKLLGVDNLDTLSQIQLRQFYQESELVTHRLLFGQHYKLDDKRSAVDKYLASDNRNFWQTIGMQPKQLRLELSRYQRRKKSFKANVSPALASPKLQQRCLSKAELVAYLVPVVTELNPQLALTWLDELSPEQRYMPLWLIQKATALAAVNDYKQAHDLAQQARKLGSRNADTLIGLTNLQINSCTVTKAKNQNKIRNTPSTQLDCENVWQKAANGYRQALELDPSRIDAVYGMGLSYLHSFQAGDATNYLRLAYARAPWSYRINFYLGESLRISGNPRARHYLLRARNWAHNAGWRSRADAALAELDTTTQTNVGHTNPP